MFYGRLPDPTRESTKDSKNCTFTSVLQESDKQNENSIKSPEDDLFSNLLQPNPAFRLGNQDGDIDIIKSHAFFVGIDWDLLKNKEIEPPFVPDLAHDHDTTYFDRKLTSLTFDQDI
mmetsp:Transcript_7546/g.8582  ORF Transcript_7546/g.8582 Transcript_7546/m.8582 type:complete len:117 (-) Transcript_7546:86-436(-)